MSDGSTDSHQPTGDERYRAAVAALQSRGRFGIRLGLGRTRALLRALGDPHAGLRGALIGGTNGKGSTQALVGAALRAAGLRVGQMPKPHLAEYAERVQVDGQPLAAAEFADAVEDALRAAGGLAPRQGPPTEFEVLTAAAFLAFSRSGVEVAVVEVGLGGRLDATNTWQGGVSAITNVALDHTEHLGPTIARIAREKAPIIKRGDAAAVTGAEGEALAIIRRRAARVGVPLTVVEPLAVVGMDRRGLRLLDAGGQGLQLGLLGRHQAANAAVALAVLEALATAGIAAVSPAAVRRGFATARWPGRLELLGPDEGFDPDVLLDGAHNPHGTAALAAALDELRPQLSAGPPVLLIGVLRDKDVAAMLAPLRSAAGLADATVIATRVPDTPRSLAAAELAAAWGQARAVEDPAQALADAREASQAGGGPLIVCGSLYLVGYIRGRLVPAS
jgi:dihydrofolate synthase/folylpolyglutamate synthase